LKQRKNGFFVECGAYDGELYSNTVFFELKRNWTGLLLEVSQVHFQGILTRNRHTYSLNSCLSPIRAPKYFRYQEVPLFAGLLDYQEKAHTAGVKAKFNPQTKVFMPICYPLYSIMLALGRNRIDFLSLDVEGAELPILRTIPFDKIYIEIIVAEYYVMNSPNDTERKIKEFREFFASTKLYKEIGIVHIDMAFRRIDSM